MVVVYGLGIVGQHILRLLRALGARCRIVAVARHPFQRELALSGGADAALINPPRAELGECIGAALLPTTLGGGNLEGGADLLFDCVGSAHSFQEGLLALRGGGTYVLVATAARLRGVEGRVFVRVEGFDPVFAIADEDLERENETKTSS
ncbi:MAG: zinc-binding dehydrogenase, partial [Syntrophobacteraceae bacterium]|nr:zinc-binding dehydrogenase [Syntrophobacteraceae bacterium]